jgi:hypothetical protein
MMMVFFEVSAPFRPKLKVEKIGALRRYIWLWFSIGYINAGFNSLNRAVREDERAKLGLNHE